MKPSQNDPDPKAVLRILIAHLKVRLREPELEPLKPEQLAVLRTMIGDPVAEAMRRIVRRRRRKPLK